MVGDHEKPKQPSTEVGNIVEHASRCNARILARSSAIDSICGNRATLSCSVPSSAPKQHGLPRSRLCEGSVNAAYLMAKKEADPKVVDGNILFPYQKITKENFRSFIK
jgi:hypothetical protein